MMLKGKAMTILLSAVSALVALALVAVGVTYAWYSTHVADQTGFEMHANGVMVVLFDDASVTFDNDLVPAVSVKDKITDNVTDFGDVTDEDNPLLVSPATIATGTTYVEYLNSSSEDPEDAGTIGADVRLQVEARLVFGVGDEKELSLSRDLCVTAAVTVVYSDGVTPNQTPTVVFGSALTETFHVTGDCRIRIDLSVYFRQVDDLVDPDILRAQRENKELRVSVVSTFDAD